MSICQYGVILQSVEPGILYFYIVTVSQTRRQSECKFKVISWISYCLQRVKQGDYLKESSPIHWRILQFIKSVYLSTFYVKFMGFTIQSDDNWYTSVLTSHFAPREPRFHKILKQPFDITIFLFKIKWCIRKPFFFIRFTWQKLISLNGQGLFFCIFCKISEILDRKCLYRLVFFFFS
jgi:hypothetical protein